MTTETGVTVQFKADPDFKPDTRLAIEWFKKSDGNYAAVDRGAASDIYECVISTYGTEIYINDICDKINDNRIAEDNVIVLTDFATTEKIFGAEVVYTSINATVLEMKRRNQGTWKGFGVEMRLRAIAPTFSGSYVGPVLKYCDVGIDADSDLTIQKYDTNTGTMTYIDSMSDSGLFTGIFTLSDANMIKMRRYLAYARTANWVMTDSFGVAYPFGINSEHSYDFATKIIAWKDLGMFGVKWWRIKLTFAEVV
jgi:hypothetical protein